MEHFDFLARCQIVSMSEEATLSCDNDIFNYRLLTYLPIWIVLSCTFIYNHDNVIVNDEFE